MRRSTTLVLVLTGSVGAGILAPVLLGPWAACRDARAANQPNAAEICRSGSSSGHGFFSRSGGRGSFGSSGSGYGVASVVRGGFGAFGAAMHSGS